jgi:hypothetical protein
VHGAGIQGVCQYLANSRNKWVVVQDADYQVRLQAAPAQAEPLLLPNTLTDELLRSRGLTRVVEPIPSRLLRLGRRGTIPITKYSFSARSPWRNPGGVVTPLELPSRQLLCADDLG